MAAGHPEQPHSDLEEYLGQAVVIDTRSSYIIIGTLRALGREYLTLENVDVHDNSTTKTTTKDRYILESRKLGVCVNRNAAKVRVAEIVSISRLDDVMSF